MTTVMSGFSPEGYVEYGERFLQTFDQFWPQDIGLLVFAEDHTPIPRNGERSLWTCDGVQQFIGRNSRDARKRGRAPVPGWRPRDHEREYSFRWDAVKFCRQCFIPEQAAKELPDGDLLVWLDADVITHSSVPSRFVDSLIGDADLCYLGRARYHTELGFWAVRLNTTTRLFLSNWSELWRSDDVFKLSEWHSAFTFDYMLAKFQTGKLRLKVKNLTPNGRGHVWFNSPLARYTDHLKGRLRKQLGHSLERMHGV